MKKLSFIPLLIFLLVNIQCGGGGDRTYSGTTPVSIKITEVTGETETGSGADGLSGAVKTHDLASAVADGEGAGRQLSLCRFTITGPGMADMVREVDVTGKDSISETFNVPSGVSRQFLIQMFVEDNDTVIYQAMRDGVNLEGVPVDLEIKPEFEDAYFEAPTFSGINSLENSESKSVMLNWNPATDNVTSPERIQYQVYLSNESLSGRDDVNCDNLDEIYILGKGLLGGDSLVTINGDSGLMSYEYEGTLPASATSSNGVLNTGVTYYFIVEAQDEWGNVDRKCVESEPVIVYQLAVSTVGSGRVITEPKGIDCGIKCSEDFLTKKEITLTAEAYEGATFEGWTGNEQCDGTGDCILTLSNNESIIANFCDSQTYYNDVDGDGYGDSATVIYSCTELDQDIYVANGDDCDDNNPAINPDAAEVCDDAIDNDCDGAIDFSDTNCQTCVPGATQTCNTGQQGVCQAGTETCVALGFWGLCMQDVQPSAEVCDNQDNDCDGLIDEELSRPTTCGVGECLENTGTETCSNGVWGNDTCDPVAGAGDEVCEGILDENCDGFVDEGCDCTIGDTRSCGIDIGECVSGTESCTDGQWSGICDGEVVPIDEVCDNKDNDCDGQIDEDLTRPTSCGVGECSGNAGIETCSNGNWGNDTCDPDAGAVTESCDGLDNDCDGSVDDNPTDAGGACSAGIGECLRNGVKQCVSGELECDAVQGTPGTEICDGKDNDCDGNVDDNPTDAGGACSAGIGECLRNGVKQCVSGELECDAVSGTPGLEECDGLDNDCDGEIDNNPTDAGGACSAGIGECLRNGVKQCVSGELECDAVPGTPGLEECDGLDNDCDGEIDEDLIVLPCDTGLLGECQFGVPECQGGSTVCIAPDPQKEKCDDKDNDCNGEIDDGVC